jgi:hypothetical protein
MNETPLTQELPRFAPAAIEICIRAADDLPANRQRLNALDLALALLRVDCAGTRVLDVLTPGHIPRLEAWLEHARSSLGLGAASFGEIDLPEGRSLELDVTAREVFDRLALDPHRAADSRNILVAETQREESVVLDALIDLGLGGTPDALAPQIEALARRTAGDPASGAGRIVFRPQGGGSGSATGKGEAAGRNRRQDYSGPIDRSGEGWTPPPGWDLARSSAGAGSKQPSAGSDAGLQGGANVGDGTGATGRPAGGASGAAPSGPVAKLPSDIGPVIDLLELARADGSAAELLVAPAWIRRVLAALERNPLTVVVCESPETGDALAQALASQLVHDLDGTFGHAALAAIEPGYLATQPANAVRDGLSAAQGGILYLPDVARYLDPKRAGGADSDLRRALARRDVRILGTILARDAGRRWPIEDAPDHEMIYLDPSGVDETIAFLTSRRDRLQKEFSTASMAFVIRDEAIATAARVADRYYRDPPPPAGAVRLIHEAATAIKVRATEGMSAIQDARVAADPAIDADDVMLALERITGIKAQLDDQARLLGIQDALRQRVVGQNEAIGAVADAILRARAGLKDANRPIGSFIFMGPSGVGKTELAKALADFLFDDENAMVRLDMSEYHERHTISRLIGAPPGYVGYDAGGQLTEPVRKKPYQLVLFDEIEKSHQDVHAILLQIMDDGRLTDSQGRTVDFRNTVIIMTGNVGSEYFRVEAELGREAVVEAVMEASREAFRPEFIGRVDEFLIFNSLGAEDMRLIVDIQERKLSRKLAEQGMGIRLSDALKDHLAQAGYAPELGARPLRGAIRRLIERPLSLAIIEGRFVGGDHIEADLGPEAQAVFVKRAAAD